MSKLPTALQPFLTEHVKPTLGTWVEAACVLEATARKPGNVHPNHSFADTNYADFIQSARCIATLFDRTPLPGAGQLVLDAVTATRQTVGKNTNLGMILILVPLALTHTPEQNSVEEILRGLTIKDAQDVYQAIRLASPGGLGHVNQQDVGQSPSVTLLQAMRLAADRDLIAKQYVTAYQDIHAFLLPVFEHALAAEHPLEQAIVLTYLRGLATLGDTLILRKCGPEVMNETMKRAEQVLSTGWPLSPDSVSVFFEFDAWLRADGHRRNPGTMADLIAGVLFLALRNGSITLPLEIPWECPALNQNRPE